MAGWSGGEAAGSVARALRLYTGAAAIYGACAFHAPSPLPLHATASKRALYSIKDASTAAAAPAIRPDNSLRPAAPFSSIPECCLVLRDAETSSDLYILGCLHGSPTSSRDVENVINESSPGAVVLELCESRFKALSRELAAESVKEETEVERIHAVLGGWVRGLKSTQQKKGLLQALTAGLVSSGYLWQKLNNFDPGCEFKTAMALSNARGIDIVLGDRDINETLGRLNGKNKQGKRAPELQPNAPPPPPLLKAKKRWSVDRSLAYVRGLGRDARVLRLAVAGESGQQWPAALNVPRCIFWRGDVLKDLFGLLAR
eukprot:TRINITY_DN1966_c0_g1_i5.p1 TRINITY_DN1966_c0_g1~~TRINITY_DN1966_c0_g1_i5.p1  ORF type:complete len:326 (-),score=86.59 TRINITY_DN1966_c0_g1_i5:460-1407(-)